MEAWVSVPIESRQLQRLIDQLGLRGGAADLQQALAAAIELWLTEQRKLQVGGDPCAVHGFQWKAVFLPDGTLLRTVSYHDEQCARVQGSEIMFNGRAVTPNQLAHWAGRGTRNAWNDIYVRRPQDKFYIQARRLRSLVRQEQEQARAYSVPSDCMAAITSPTAKTSAIGDEVRSVAITPANNVLVDLVSTCAAVLQKALQTIPTAGPGATNQTALARSLATSPAVKPAPRDCSRGEGWELPERRQFRFRLEDVAFS